MQKLEAQIRRAIFRGQWSFTNHAEERLAERNVEGWQIVEGIAEGETLEVDLSSKPNPKILVRQNLADGTPIIAVWAYIKSIRSATLITIYFEVE